MGIVRLVSVAALTAMVLAAPPKAAELGSAGDDFWDGFYLGILGGVGTGLGGGTVFANAGAVAGAGTTTNDGFYFGAEAYLAGESYGGSAPYLWLEADGRIGFVVGEKVLLFGSGGLAYDTDAQTIALTGGGGAEFAVSEGLTVRGQYAVQYYPNGIGTFHQGLVGLFWQLD